ncbi:MAG: hypothetical protein KDE53_05510, partial [Caldilineaceae bacterium]|nr:hypothetical protein [Caldilineaceae bacterium]
TSLGHRTMMIDPKYTDFGVGCFYPNNYNDITCVLNYAENWVEKMNMVKPEIGKQYAHSEGDGKFRYFVLSSVTNRGQFPVRIEVCPDKMGWVDMPDTAGLTTVEAALAEGLVATNTPCATDAAPHGILNNGASLPVTSSSGQNEQTQEVKLPFVAGNAMVQGQKYFSESGNHYLIFQTDGNLVVYTALDKYVWGIGALTREYQQAQSVSMEADGNFVVRGADNAKIWSALQANPDASASLTLTPEGALQLVSGAGVLWSSIERPFDEPTDGRLPLTAGQTLTEREKYFSESGNHYLVFQTDGNLVVYTADDKFVWGLNTVTDRYQQAVSVQMQSDGNLVVRGADNQPVWSALDANPDPGASLVLTPEGVLQLVSGSGDIMWTSDR